ncbi:MAG TPA: hypothetical protein VH478_04845 [Trebonia sp.]|nr:hypothetical protein [Trebonia sp.]
MRKITVAGVVALVAVLGSAGAITASIVLSGPASAALTSATAASTATAASAQDASLLAATPATRADLGTRPGAPLANPVNPAQQHLAYPAGVKPAATTEQETLNSVSCLAVSNCLAVGGDYGLNAGHGSPRTFHWNGSAWSAVSVPLPSATTGGSLFSVSCNGTCVAVGAYFRGTSQYVLAEAWNGTGWTLSLPEAIPGSLAPVLSVVSCASAAYCVGVGYYTPASNHNGSVAIAETWTPTGGWTLFTAPNTTSYDYDALYGVSCTATNFCLMGGEYASSNGGYFTSLVERFNGSGFTRVTDAAQTVANHYATYINSVSCRSSVACVLVGEQTKIASTVTWQGWAETYTGKWARTGAAVPATGGSILNSVSCAVSNYCIAVGGFGAYNWPTTGNAIFSIWNGSTWALHFADAPSGQGNLLVGDQCLTTTYCVAAGTQGTYNTDAGHGETWSWNGASFTLAPTA